jgi:hypothetical protein
MPRGRPTRVWTVGSNGTEKAVKRRNRAELTEPSVMPPQRPPRKIRKAECLVVNRRLNGRIAVYRDQKLLDRARRQANTRQAKLDRKRRQLRSCLGNKPSYRERRGVARRAARRSRHGVEVGAALLPGNGTTLALEAQTDPVALPLSGGGFHRRDPRLPFSRPSRTIRCRESSTPTSIPLTAGDVRQAPQNERKC